ncbi:pyridoxal phosphate-dependent aminotransferase [Lactobacillus mulieris]|uniref:MalY/PatB family protein n=1 Tax=Lactobacillus mulieris TaxID=2508708 RepID=UPI001F2D0918|nr:MalY/PatB family protein [Lactobacillus mulieris]MCF1784316.1 pyridoxal phosphate-dependent aminotransferase [Lactobacillus mulieris]MCW8104391.1 pyridoxal phosphate-dependent aminotransferase [Lactobacillus mulieris]
MYSFDQMPNRRGTNSIKWNVKDYELPMWIADMDFGVAPEIIQAMQDKIKLGAFGYESIPNSYYDAIVNWQEKQHNCQIKKDWILFVNGVIPALSSAVRRLTHPGEQILTLTPVYNIFFHSIENNGRKSLEEELEYDVNSHEYRINWSSLEQKLADPLTKMMILCNPHNPIGKSWSYEEIKKIAQLCNEYHVYLFSDEIHGDLVLDDSFSSSLKLPDKLKQNLIVAFSPSKTFNLAALHSASVVVPNPELRFQIYRAINNDEIAEPNLLAIPATIAAYTQGSTWLHELKAYLLKNRQYIANFLENELSQLNLTSEFATYLAWIDISNLNINSQELAEFLKENTGLIISSGKEYRGNGANFIRLNFACPRSVLIDGLERLKRGINSEKA